MVMKLLRYILIALLMPTIPVAAQTIAGSDVRIDNSFIQLGENKQLMVGMDITIPAEMQLSSNRLIILTPVLKSSDGSANKLLPAVYLYGRTRSIVQEREHRLPTDAYAILLRKNGTAQQVNYTNRLPFEGWMNGATLELFAEVRGCADCLKEGNSAVIARAHVERYVVKPTIAFVAPEVEEIKNRSEKGSAFLDFPVNKTVIYPEYRRNTAELARIKGTVDVVRNDSNTHITRIDIKGHASPEGSYANNVRLAKGRSEALKQYVMKEYGFGSDLFSVSYEPEDWAGLRRYVAESSLPGREEILALIDSDMKDLDAKERRIKAVEGGRTYAVLLKDCYPALRHSDYVVHYVVRGFNVEEAKRIIRERPQQLSLQEMYLVAQTYEKGSPEFNEVFDIAVRMFPDDATANTNAAAVALQQGDLPRAETYLGRIKTQTAAVLNNRGVLMLLQGDLDAAEALFQQAGSTEAAANLKEVASKRQDEAIFK